MFKVENDFLGSYFRYNYFRIMEVVGYGISFSN